jgi:small subunit ribosomal protein S16
MSVVIRMKRTGRKNRPFYRISVADSRDPRDGRTLEALGHYDPIASKPEMQLQIDLERAKHWIERGARPSETVASILARLGVRPAPKPKRDRSGRKKKTAARTRRKSDKLARATAKGERRSARRKAAAEARKASAGAAAEA